MPNVLLHDLSQQLRELLEQDQDYPAGFALGRHILRFWPKHLDTYAQLGRAALAAGMYEDAIDCFQRLLSADPEAGELWAGLRQALTATEQLEAATHAALHERDLQPDPTGARLSPLARANLAAQEGNWQEALAHYRQAQPEMVGRMDAALGLATTLAYLERFDLCEQVAEVVLEQLPHSLKAHLLLLRCAERLGKTTSPRQENMIADLDPDGFYAWDRFGAIEPPPSPAATLPAWDPGDRWSFPS